MKHDLNNVGLRHNETIESIMLIFTQFPTTVHVAWDVLSLKVRSSLSREIRQVDFLYYDFEML